MGTLATHCSNPRGWHTVRVQPMLADSMKFLMLFKITHTWNYKCILVEKPSNITDEAKKVSSDKHPVLTLPLPPWWPQQLAWCSAFQFLVCFHWLINVSIEMCGLVLRLYFWNNHRSYKNNNFSQFSLYNYTTISKSGEYIGKMYVLFCILSQMEVCVTTTTIKAWNYSIRQLF